MSLILPRPAYALVMVLSLCVVATSASAQQSDEPAPAIAAPVAPADEATPAQPGPQPQQLAPALQQALLAYTKGLAELNNGNYEKAIELLSFAISQKPNDPQFHYMAAKAYEAAGEFRGQWFHLRKAVRLKLDHEQAVQDFMRMWQVALDKGVLDVGSPQANVKAALGEPDAKQTQTSTVWQYGFMGVEFYQDRVAAVLDLRGSGNFTAPLEDLEIVLDGSREWKIKQQIASRSEFKVVYAPVETTEPAEIVTHNRLINLRNKMTVTELMQKMQAGLEYEFPEVQWKLLQSSDDDVLFEWWLDSEGLPKQHEIVRLLAGTEDIHRLAYTVKTAPLDGETHQQWINRLQAAKLIDLKQ